MSDLFRAAIFATAITTAAGCDCAGETGTGSGPKSLILIGWDGTQWEHLEQLLAAGKLPNLRALIAEGSYARNEITTGATQTKQGWAEITTGYNAESMGIFKNRHYRPIPPAARFPSASNSVSTAT